MSKILIVGGAGMIGQKLAHRIAAGSIDVNVSELVLYDIVDAIKPEASFSIQTISGNIADPGESIRLAAMRPDIVFHLASIVSGEAETNFDKGWDINARGSWQLLEALRTEHDVSDGSYRPRFVFASSIAVFGGPYPDKIDDDFLCAPQTSYGAQKAMIELLVADYSRKGFIDGFSMRLPTVCVRPGKANLAASSFFSGIIREPLSGQQAILPVSDQTRHWHVSPRMVAKFFTQAATLDSSILNGRYSLNLPGVSCTVAEQIEALREIAGNDVVKLIKPQHNEAVDKIVSGWPRNFDPKRARALGFESEADFGEIIRIYMEDDLPSA